MDHTPTRSQIVQILELLLSSTTDDCQEAKPVIEGLLSDFKNGSGTPTVEAGLRNLTGAEAPFGHLVFLALGAVRDQRKRDAFTAAALTSQGLM